MSCGKPHELDCESALEHLYEYLDGEVAPTDHQQIAQHLQECGPCLQEYDVERIVKALVARSCCEVAPAQLRSRLVAELVSVRIQYTPTDEA
jgi:mycothiol system anti-sigma-R factor